MISVVLPVHNEEEYLPFSLNALVKAPIDELIIILDRCTDRSEHIINRVKFPYKVQIIKKTDQKWRCATAEVFEIGFSHTKGDFLYTMAADFVLDYRNQFDLRYFEKADILSFFYYAYDLHQFKYRQWYLNFLNRYINIAKIWQGQLAWRSGHMAFKRELWEKLHLQDVPSEYDNFLERAIKAGFQYKFVRNVKNYHLRVGLRKDRQLLQGMSRAQRGVHPLMVLGHCFIHFKPYVWVGYWHERRHQFFQTRKWSKNGY